MTFQLEAPLPDELAGRAQGWFTAYRRYPVFSRPWMRGRLRLTGTVLGLFFLMLAPLLFNDNPRERPWPVVAVLALELWLPALLGPWLGWRIRRLALPPRQELAALAAMLLALAVAVCTFYLHGEESVKNAVAAAAGQLDENGQRPKVRMMLGISITDERGDPKVDRDPDGTPNRTINVIVRGSLTLLLGGVLALRGLQRERHGLAALEQERALARAEAARREAELRLSVLAAQVEPHFLFNTLAGVRSAIATDPARASDMIDRLVEYLRAAIPRLRSDGRAQATVGAQFDIVRAYLGLMASRMPRLSFDVSAEPELLKAHCPPLMLISLAENAVKHGVEAKIGPARVSVSAARTAEGALALTVADDGVGFGGAQSGSGLGLANIRERLAQLYGDRAALSLKARPEGGVAATITLPLETP